MRDTTHTTAPGRARPAVILLTGIIAALIAALVIFDTLNF